jgi:hypothetical protein
VQSKDRTAQTLLTTTHQRMARPAAYSRTQCLQRSFNLLCEYLNSGDDSAAGGTAGLVKRVLRSALVRPFFDEYKWDYLMKVDETEDIDFHSLQSSCSKKGAFKSARYSRRGPVDKSKWGAFEHAARYMVQTLQYSWGKREGPWDQGEWDPESDDGDVEFWQVRYVDPGSLSHFAGLRIIPSHNGG